MKIHQIMTPDPEVVRPNSTLQEAARLMRELDVGLIPVCDGDRLQGVLSDRDITLRATAEGLDPSRVEVQQVMTPDVAFCYEDQEAGDAATLMKEKQIRRLMILNRDKKLTGIVSLGDLAVRGADSELSGDTLDEVSQPGSSDH
jgi:CBS domain-containing protein